MSSSVKRMKLTIKIERPTLQGNFGRYKLGQKIGSGAFAVVRLGENVETGEAVAVKLIDKRHTTQIEEAKEVALLERAGAHPNIVALIESFETHVAWGLVLELARGGEVFERLAKQGAPFSERDAAGVVRQVAQALAHCHERSICHHDVKPENLLFVSSAPDAVVKLTDFGLAEHCACDVVRRGGTAGGGKQTQAPSMTGKVGTLAYMAPEMLKPQSSYDLSIDNWALGVSLFILLGGYLPFDPQQRYSQLEMETAIKAAEPAFSEEQGGWSCSWTHVSAEAKAVVNALLHPDPLQRATPASLLESCLWMHHDPTRNTSTHAPLPKVDEKLRHFNEQRRVWRLAAGAVGLVVNAPCMIAAAARAGEEKEQGDRGGGKEEGDSAAVTAGADSSARAFAAPGGGGSGGGDATLHACLDDNALEDLRRAFRVFDKDGNGSIDHSELVSVVCRLGGTEQDAEELLESMDANHDGLITFDEFCAASVPLYSGGQLALRRAFDLIDQDKCGFLDVQNVEALLNRLGMHCSRGTVHLPPPGAGCSDDQGDGGDPLHRQAGVGQEELLSEVFASADLDHDGKVDFADFLALFNKPLFN